MSTIDERGHVERQETLADWQVRTEGAGETAAVVTDLGARGNGLHRGAGFSAGETLALRVAVDAKRNRRSWDLAASNRQLEKEIARRQAMEETLRQSKRHTRRLLTQSRHLQDQMRLLSRRVLSAQEEERKRK